MKTTVELPDDLFRRAKAHAATHGTTLRNLIDAGLRRELDAREQPRAEPFRIEPWGSPDRPLARDALDAELRRAREGRDTGGLESRLR